MQLGVPAEKLVLALPMYGRTYILTKLPEKPDENPIGLPALPNGFKGPYTGQEGFMGYNEVFKDYFAYLHHVFRLIMKIKNTYAGYA